MREGERADGRKPRALTAEFRNEFRTAVLVAVFRGLADMMNSAGLPTSSCRKYMSEENSEELTQMSRSSCSAEFTNISANIGDQESVDSSEESDS
jgi:hypothetical protein